MQDNLLDEDRRQTKEQKVINLYVCGNAPYLEILNLIGQQLRVGIRSLPRVLWRIYPECM